MPATSARAGYDFLVGDDIRTLQDPNASVLAKLGAAADLGSWAIPGAKVEELAAKAAERVAEAAAKMGLDHASEAIAAVAARGGRVPNINNRQLTGAERSGKFDTFDDFKDFMGSLGDGNIYHHTVEKNNAVSAASRTPQNARFPDSEIQSVERVVPVTL